METIVRSETGLELGDVYTDFIRNFLAGERRDGFTFIGDMVTNSDLGTFTPKAWFHLGDTIDEGRWFWTNDLSETPTTSIARMDSLESKGVRIRSNVVAPVRIRASWSSNQQLPVIASLQRDGSLRATDLGRSGSGASEFVLQPDDELWIVFVNPTGFQLLPVQVITELVTVADTTPPAISITSPSGGQVFTSPAVTVTGTASDDVAVGLVEVRVNGGSWQVASGTSSCSADVNLTPGPNTIDARVTHTSGNTNQASVTVSVCQNTSPATEGASPATDEDVPVEITLRATDSLECELALTIVAGPADGSLCAITGQVCTEGDPNSDTSLVTYTPNLNFNGTDSFTYKANDGNSDSNVEHHRRPGQRSTADHLDTGHHGRPGPAPQLRRGRHRSRPG